MSQLKGSRHLKISFKAIEKATQKFIKKKCIGTGGYGMVYKGDLIINGKPTTVAIKRLNEQYGQGLKEFLTEIQLLSGQRHSNLIYLVGYCDEEKEKIIVYEYAERGSLDKYLRRSNMNLKLTWLERLKICGDAARGLDYLHNHAGKHQAIIHRDIKSANILIDKNWVAKVSDLGLSKLSLAGLNRSEVVSHACGTRGYCEPEYFITGIVKKESDIYSFGMVLFEVLCGRLCTIKDDDGFFLSCSLAKDYYEKKRLDEIIDPSLKGEMNLKSMNKFATVAYRCLHEDRGQRPPMGLVVKELEESLKLQTSQRSSSKSHSKSESQGPSSKSYSKNGSQSSRPNYSLRKSNISCSNPDSKQESRLEKVKKIFREFDLNKDGGLNKEELEQLLLATRSDLKNYSLEQISSGINDVFHQYNKFIDGTSGLTLDGLLQIYEDGDADLDRDYEVLGLKVKHHNHSTTGDRYDKARNIFHRYDLNGDGGLNKEELAALIVATNPNIRYCDEEISTTLDDFFDLYSRYIDGEKGLTFDGLFQSFNQGDVDLDLAFEILRLELIKNSVDQVPFEQVPYERRKRNSVVVYVWAMSFLAACVVLPLLGFRWEKYIKPFQPELYVCSSDSKICKGFFDVLSMFEFLGVLAELAP